MKVNGNMYRIWNLQKLNVDEICCAMKAIDMLRIKIVQRIYFGDVHTMLNLVVVHQL